MKALWDRETESPVLVLVGSLWLSLSCSPWRFRRAPAVGGARAPADPPILSGHAISSPACAGYGLSDLGDGRGVQRFEVEIIGLLKNYAPKQDLDPRARRQRRDREAPGSSRG